MGPKSKSKGEKCAGCGTKIDGKEPVVEAMNKKYHKNCFVCVNCQKPVEKDFHPVNGAPWCAECFREKHAPRCADCGEPISETIVKTDDGRTFHEACSKKLSQGTCDGCKSMIAYEEPIVEALGQRFHRDCFRCASCGGAVPEKFHAENGRPWCDNCYNENLERKSPVCDGCSKPITKGTRLELAGRSYHEDCFSTAGWSSCDGCGKTVLFTEPCVRVTALNRYWHLGCLNCNECNTNIQSPFYWRKEQACCDACYLGHIAPKCQGCAQPIPNQQVKALNAFWHPECFVCAVCHEMLHRMGREYFNVQGQPYCKHDVEAAGIPVVN
ncbi:four and a half LIM domains protein 3-like [Paramacrobiotus metropolitanus]|uniref:four and a half LIM domains protein 3-like n=1 Tax=Paramacrobiotus metropolitanus TaxID=2943436 RepID=UPI00244581E4|nr:four and a half LIM domains protein 3-like [Paramacrobiotus metropolitanus]